MILNGTEIANKIKENLKNEIESLKKMDINPKLVVFQVGENDASTIYIRNKQKACESVGIDFELVHLEENTSQKELENEILKKNQDPTVHGILVQSPLPKHMKEEQVFETILPEKDVDGFTTTNVGKLWNQKTGLISCTPKGVIRILKEYDIPIEGKHVVIIGRSNIVGKPLALLFLKENASVTILHSKSKEIAKITKEADILVSAVGKPNFVTKDMVKENAIVIDVGINRLDGKVIGDVDFLNVSPICSYITPVPKGVGPMTIAMILENVVISCNRKITKKGVQHD